MSESVYISNIQRFSVHDGPGIRTTVFFLGCPLRCGWCQNPETFKKSPELMLNNTLCAGCGACAGVCPVNAIEMKNGLAITDRKKCIRCGACTDVCYFGARELSGRLYTAAEVSEAVLKDEVVYRNTGGGITFSGGEPLLYPEFVREVFSVIKEKGHGTAIETCGYVGWEAFECVLPVTDLLLYDIKLADRDRHLEWTGVDNKRIRENAVSAAKLTKLIPRIPLIPGVNDDAPEFGAILDICESLEGVKEIHLMPFHQIGSSKYGMLDYAYNLAGRSEENAPRIEFCRLLAEKRGFSVNIGGSGNKDEIEDNNSGPGNDEGWFIYRK